MRFYRIDEFHLAARSKRLALGIGVRQLARMVKVSPTTIQQVEAGNDARISTVFAIADALKMDVVVDREGITDTSEQV